MACAAVWCLRSEDTHDNSIRSQQSGKYSKAASFANGAARQPYDWLSSQDQQFMITTP